MAVDLKLVRVATAENPDVGDLEVSGRDFVLINGLECKAQQIEVALRTELGEWFLDVTRGVPWIAQLLRKGTPLATVREVLVGKILEVGEIVAVRRLDLEVDPATRELTGEAEIEAEGAVGTATLTIGG